MRVLYRGAQADARPAVHVQAHASTVNKDTVRKVPGARQRPVTIADNAKA
jgi:hypothetical protein